MLSITSIVLVLCLQSTIVTGNTSISVWTSIHHFPLNVAPFIISTHEQEDRIIGGVEANRGEFPFIVSLQIQSKSGVYKHACAGSILNPNWIITAGHCSVFKPENYKIVAGAFDLSNLTGQEQIRSASQVITHPKYDPYTIDYDIALIRVNQPFNFTERISATTLPQGPPKQFTGKAVSAGWGLLHRDDKDTPPILQKISLPIIDRLQCLMTYKFLNLTVTDRMMCAGIEEGKSVCNGDSGGPLLCQSSQMKDKTNGNVLCGLVSWGIRCAIQGYPGVFTKVDELLQFINQYINEN